MPKYTLPKEKARKKGNTLEAVADLEWMRRVSLPANKDIAQEAAVGERVEVKLIGKVIEVSIRETEDSSNRSEIRLSIDSVELYGENEFSELAEDDD